MILLDQTRLVPSLPEPAGGSILAVMSPNMRGEQPTHPRGDVTIIPGPHDQVHMIWHQADSEQRQFQSVLGFAHVLQERGVVAAFVEHTRLLVAAIDDVVTLVR